jgi:hypothetical protein
MSNRQAFPWLARTGQCWKLQVEVWAGLLGFAGVLLSLLFSLAAFVVGPAVLWAVGVIWGLHGFAQFGALWLKYHRIRCPWCGHNPTREVDGGCWLPGDVVHEKMAGLEVCPTCGYAGPERTV